VTGQACTISTASSGTLLISSAAALQLTGVATTLTTTGAVVWTHSGGTFVVTSTSQDLSLVTDTAGDIAITSAAALGLTGVATTFTTTGAVVWTHSGGAFGITSTSQNLSLITATAGDIAITSAAALTLTAPANTSITCASHVNATAKGNSTIVVAGAVGDGSFDVDVDGNFGVDSSNGRFYFRYGAAWHYCTQDA